MFKKTNEFELFVVATLRTVEKNQSPYVHAYINGMTEQFPRNPEVEVCNSIDKTVLGGGKVPVEVRFDGSKNIYRIIDGKMVKVETTGNYGDFLTYGISKNVVCESISFVESNETRQVPMVITDEFGGQQTIEEAWSLFTLNGKTFVAKSVRGVLTFKDMKTSTGKIMTYNFPIAWHTPEVQKEKRAEFMAKLEKRGTFSLDFMAKARRPNEMDGWLFNPANVEKYAHGGRRFVKGWDDKAKKPTPAPVQNSGGFRPFSPTSNPMGSTAPVAQQQDAGDDGDMF